MQFQEEIQIREKLYYFQEIITEDPKIWGENFFFSSIDEKYQYTDQKTERTADSISKKKLLELIITLKNRYKKTIIIVSHDVDLIHQISDKIVVLHDGKVVLEGNKYEVFKHEEDLKKYGIKLPKAIEFSNLVYKKTGKKIGYRDDINDILKDVYRNAR